MRLWVPVFLNSGRNMHPQASTHSFGFLSICPTSPQGVSLVFTMVHATLAITKNEESEVTRVMMFIPSSSVHLNVHPYFQTQRRPLCHSTNLSTQTISSKWLSKCPWQLYHVYFTHASINDVPTPATPPDS